MLPSPSARARGTLRVLAPLLLMAACEGRTGPELSAAMLQTGGADGSVQLHSELWTLPERHAPKTLASGDGVRTTASSANLLLGGQQQQVYAGPRAAREDWPALAARYRSDAGVAAWVREEQRRVDGWIARNFEQPERIGGWPMAYIDRATGVPLQWSADSPEPAADPFGTSIKSSPRAAWVALGRGYNITQALAAARLYRLTGQQKYGEWAMQQLDFYATNYARWPSSSYDGRSSLYYSGLDTAVSAFDLLNTARLLDDTAAPARRAKWDEQLFAPMGRDLKGTISPMTNIDLWHQCARAAIAMRLHDEVLAEEALGSEHGIAAITVANLSVDNFWAEGTFAYNSYVIDAMSRLLVFGSLQGYAEQLKPLYDQAARLLFAPIDYRFADMSLPNPNDGIGQSEAISASAHWMLYRVVPSYWGRQKAAAWRTWESLLDPPAAVAVTPPALPAVLSRNFPSVRLAVLKAGDWQAFVHYGAAAANHYQQEMTTFELNEGRQAIARDAGTVNYASPYHGEYFSQGAANNVPLVDGAGQAQWARGSVDEFDPAQALLRVSQPQYQRDAAVTRRYRVTSAGFVEQATIGIPSGAPRRLGLVFNTRCDVDIGAGATPALRVEPLPAVSAIGRYWSNVRMWNAGNAWTATLRCGERRYALSVHGPREQRVYLSTAPDTPLPATRTALYYETSASQASFETEIRPLLSSAR